MADETNDLPDPSATEAELAAQMGQVGAEEVEPSGAEGQPADPEETQADSSPALLAGESSEPQPEDGDSVDQGTPPSDEQQVPKQRFDTEVSKRKTLETQVAAQQKELAELRGKARVTSVRDAVTSKLAKDPAFLGKDGKPLIDVKMLDIAVAAAEEVIGNRLNGSLGQVQALANERRVAQEVGVPVSTPQVRAIAKLMTEHPTLNARQAYALAQQTNPSAFSSGAARGVQPMHTSTQPSGGQSPARKPMSERDRLIKLAAEAPEGADTTDVLARAMQLSEPVFPTRQKR